MPRRKKDAPDLEIELITPAPPVFINEDDELDVNVDFEETVDAREGRKPNIDHLDDAIAVLEDGSVIPLFGVGDKLVIERRASILPGNPWLDTQTYTVTDIDDVTGDLKLMSDGYGHSAMSNFIKGLAAGYRFKLPSGSAIGKKRRGVKGRGRKPKIAATPVAAAPTAPAPDGQVKRGRGRPPGTKNRPKAVIEAERRARAAARKAKRDETQRKADEKRAAAKAARDAAKAPRRKKRS